MKFATDSELKAHVAKMRGIHGDEPIRIKTALPWAEEALASRMLIDDLVTAIEYHWSFDNAQQHTHSWHDKQDFLEAWRAKIAGLRSEPAATAGARGTSPESPK